MPVFPPNCPECGKPLKSKASCGFFECIEVVVTKVTTAGAAPTQYACKGMVKNPKYASWKQLKDKYDKEMQKYMKSQDSLVGKVVGLVAGAIKPKPPPPEPPKKIPCKNHWNKQAKGQYNERIVSKKKVFFVATGGIVKKVQNLI